MRARRFPGATAPSARLRFFLFDAERKLRYHGTVDDNHQNPTAVTQHYLRDAIEAVLASQPVSSPETAPVGCTIKWAPEG